MKINSLALITVGLAVILTSHSVISLAEQNQPTPVYRCQIDGQTVYSQTPCSQSSQKITIEHSQPKPEQHAIDAAKKRIEAVAQSTNKLDVERKIDQHYRTVERLKAQLKQEFTQLTQQRFRTSEAADKAREALKNKYHELINAEHEAIKLLLKK